MLSNQIKIHEKKNHKSINMHMPGFPTKPNGHQIIELGKDKLTIHQTYFIIFGTEGIFPILP